MVNKLVLEEELRQTQIMTILAEKRTILSELRTWITMILFPLSLVATMLAITKSFNFYNNLFFIIVIISSIILVLIIIVFVFKNIKKLFSLNKKINDMDLP